MQNLITKHTHTQCGGGRGGGGGREKNMQQIYAPPPPPPQLPQHCVYLIIIFKSPVKPPHPSITQFHCHISEHTVHVFFRTCASINYTKCVAYIAVNPFMESMNENLISL